MTDWIETHLTQSRLIQFKIADILRSYEHLIDVGNLRKFQNSGKLIDMYVLLYL